VCGVFWGLELHEAPPDHSTVSRTRRLIDLEMHQAVFTWVLQRLADARLVKGTTIGIDATTLEANAALRSIVRRDTGEGYAQFLTRLAQASGIVTPTREDLARIDRKRPNKGSNVRGGVAWPDGDCDDRALHPRRTSRASIQLVASRSTSTASVLVARSSISG
jgi:transposase